MTYREFLTGAVGMGFIMGWLSDAFLALWTYYTLGL